MAAPLPAKSGDTGMKNLVALERKVDITEVDITDTNKSPLPCRRCGKNMRYKNGSAMIGLSIQVLDEHKTPDYSSFLKSQMGDLTIGETYSFCLECFIKAIWFYK